MAEVTKGISSPARSSNSKICTAKAVRVVCISNPTIVKTSASEFRSVVQSLTGQKRSCASRKNPDDQYSPQIKIPKLHDDGLQRLNDVNCLGSAIIVDNHCCIERDHGYTTIFDELELQPIENPDYVFSHPGFDTVESIQEARNLVVDISSPPILFSEFEHF